MRQRFCKICRGWHALDAWPEECWSHSAPARSSLAAPMLIRDEMAPTVSMADGKEYTSKRAMRATYLPSGNPQGERYVEIGDHKQTATKKAAAPDDKAIDAAIGKAMSQHGLGA